LAGPNTLADYSKSVYYFGRHCSSMVRREKINESFRIPGSFPSPGIKLLLSLKKGFIDIEKDVRRTHF
jgi:hypothetical protein